MTIFNCTFVSVETRNIPAFLSEYIHSITICTNGLLFSSYATASERDLHIFFEYLFGSGKMFVINLNTHGFSSLSLWLPSNTINQK